MKMCTLIADRYRLQAPTIMWLSVIVENWNGYWKQLLGISLLLYTMYSIISLTVSSVMCIVAMFLLGLVQ